jgi:tRNA (uracil-5-)-methyltransferase
VHTPQPGKLPCVVCTLRTFVLQVYGSPPSHYRCRCEFSIWHDGDETSYVMHEAAEGSKRPMRKSIHQYDVVTQSINELMPVVLAEVHKSKMMRHKLFQAGFHVTLAGEAMVVLVYHKALAAVHAEWEQAARALRCGSACAPARDACCWHWQLSTCT